jgi:uncharacterized iron-regulated membrane protein
MSTKVRALLLALILLILIASGLVLWYSTRRQAKQIETRLNSRTTAGQPISPLIPFTLKGPITKYVATDNSSVTWHLTSNNQS